VASLSTVAAPGALEGTVVRVTDGDSVWIEPVPPGAPVELRLQDIDAPEICQAWGPEARRALQDLVLNKAVSVRVSGRDTHGRTLGTLYLDTLNVNRSMVQEGHAWSNRYKFDRGPYVADERMAKALSRGLNRDGGAVMPKDFRRDHGPCTCRDGAEGGAGRRGRPQRRAGGCRGHRRAVPLRRPHALLADAVLRGSHLLPDALPGCEDGRQPRRCALRKAVVSAVAPARTRYRPPGVVSFRLSRKASRSSVSSGVSFNGTRMRSPSACSRFSSSSE
jgi:endonuclease YncB( thermonuclease family)